MAAQVEAHLMKVFKKQQLIKFHFNIGDLSAVKKFGEFPQMFFRPSKFKMRIKSFTYSSLSKRCRTSTKNRKINWPEQEQEHNMIGQILCESGVRWSETWVIRKIIWVQFKFSNKGKTTFQKSPIWFEGLLFKKNSKKCVIS